MDFRAEGSVIYLCSTKDHSSLELYSYLLLVARRSFLEQVMFRMRGDVFHYGLP